MEIPTRAMMRQSDISFDLSVSDNLEQKIRHLCDVFETKEWSGILFYRKKGTVGKKDFKVEALDLCLMDIGTGAFTEFDDSKDVVEYKVGHEELLASDVYEGLIHSHNKMAAFFSGTDTSTLEKEGERTNHFLSLIVNNDGKYCARITRAVNSTVESVITTDSKITYDWYTFDNYHFLGKPKNKTTKEEVTKEHKTIEWFDANISVPKVKTKKKITKELDERIEEIKSRVIELPDTPIGYKPISYGQLEFDFPRYEGLSQENGIVEKAALSLISILATGNMFQTKLDVHYNGIFAVKLSLKWMQDTYTRIFGDLSNPDIASQAYYFLDSITGCVFDNAEFLMQSQFDLTPYTAEIVSCAKEFVQINMDECPMKEILVSVLEDFTIWI